MLGAPGRLGGGKLAREAGLPSVIKVVGSDVLMVSGRARRARMAGALLRADAVVAVSRDLADRVVALGVPAGRVHVIYNGLDGRLFRPGDRAEARARLGLPADGPIVLFVGNLLMSKGIGVLVDALAVLARRGVRPFCMFLGRGRDGKKLRSAIARAGLGGSAVLLGPKAHGDLPDWYHACDVVALPSFSEGIPNVLIEASACGRPFVASAVGGIPEIAGHSASRLVPPGDPEAVARAIEEVLAWGPVEASTTPSWGESAAHLAEVLRSVVDRSPRRIAAGAPMLIGRPDRTTEAANGVLKGRDLLCFSHDWSGDPLSKTHLMRLLARENRVLWVNSIGYRTPRVSRADLGRALGKLRASFTPIREPEPNLYVLNPLAAPFYGPIGRAVNRRWLRWQVLRAIRRLGFRRPINWVFNPAAGVVAGTLGEETLIYYCVDEYAAFEGVPSAALAGLEAGLLERADLVIVSAERLLRSKSATRSGIALVRHGVDFDLFRKALDPSTTIPGEIAGLPRPILGYFGLIAPDWVDVGLLVKVVRRFPGASLVMLGKVAMDLSALEALPNVHILGRQPYDRLPNFCRGFDVALIPFPIGEVTLNANPLKAREYLAAGLPVVSTAIPEVAVLPHCRVADGHDAFLAEIEAALADPGPKGSISESMRSESWAARLEEIRGHLAAVGDRGRG